MFRRTKASMRKLSIFLFNIAVTSVFFFGLRRLMLNTFGNNVASGVAIHSSVSFFSISGLVVGRNTTINNGCYLDTRVGINIGSNVNISHDVRIYSLGHDINDPFFITKGEEVNILDDVWIFPNVIIMPGVTIGERSIVLPGAVVTKSYGAGSVIGGNPSMLIKQTDREVLYSLDNRIYFAK